jgi:hypothetical protein
MKHLYVQLSFIVLLIAALPLCVIARTPVTNPAAKNNLVFIENKGQIVDQHGKQRKDIDFKLETPGMTLFTGKGQIHYQWSRSLNQNLKNSKNDGIEDDINSDEVGTKSPLRGFRGENSIETYRLDVTLVGANTNATMMVEEQQEYYENYYLPQCPDGATAHSYKKITYKNIYPNIDWVIYINHQSLKYDFVVRPGGNVKDIKLRYDGATSLTLNKGKLTAITPFGSITENAPYTYEQITNHTSSITNKPIGSSFVLKDNILSFDVRGHNTPLSAMGRGAGGEVLVIDPQLEWATYYGGSGGEEVGSGTFYTTGSHFNTTQVNRSIAADALGFVYMTGTTTSPSNIATAGTFQNSLAGQSDGFLVKFKTDGIRQWATYYGGNNAESIGAIAIDASNNVYIVGSTKSPGLATSGAFQTDLDTSSVDTFKRVDGLMIKFTPSGMRAWATYFGGESHDAFTSITIDSGSNIYITGDTWSTSNIATPGSFKSAFARAFLTKFNTSGVRQWGTYYGPTSSMPTWTDISGHNVVCSPSGDIYLTGTIMSRPTNDTDIATPGSHQPKFNFYCDVYLVKFNAAGARLWGTFYGGESIDMVHDISCDTSGNIYLAGITTSKTGISTPGSFQPQKSPNINPFSSYSDAFVVKFNPAGVRQWGSYFGSDGQAENFTGIVVDKAGDVCLTGLTTSKTGIATTGGWQLTKADTIDGMFVKFDPNGQRLWATYYGGEKADAVVALTVDQSSNVFLLGGTSSSTGIATPGSHQSIFSGPVTTSWYWQWGDLFLVKTQPDSVVYVEQPFDTAICVNSQVTKVKVGYIVSRSFRAGNIFTVQLSDSNGSFASPTVIGTRTATASGYIDCTVPTSVAFASGYRIRVVASAPFYISNDNGKDITIMPGPEKPIASNDTGLCSGQTLKLFASNTTPGVSYSWAGPNGFSSPQQNLTRENVIVADSGEYIVTVSPFECKMKDTVHVTVLPTPIKPVISHNAPICEGDTFLFDFVVDTSGGTFYTWAWPKPVPGNNNVVPNVTTEFTGDYIVVAMRGPCVSRDTSYVYIKPKPVPTPTSNSPVKQGEMLKLFSNGDSLSSYYWEGPDLFTSTLSNPVISPASTFQTGTYSLVVTKDGCVGSGITIVIVEGTEKDIFTLYPNPNDGRFTVKGILRADQEVFMEVVNYVGQSIYSDKATSSKKLLQHNIVLPAVASGGYMLRIRAGGRRISIPFIVGHK